MASLITNIDELIDLLDTETIIVNGKHEFNDITINFNENTGEIERIGRGQ